MNRKYRFALIALFLCLPAVLFAWGKKEEKKPSAAQDKGTVIQVSGRVRLVGNNPFPELVITGDRAEWYIGKNDEYKLKDLQHRTVTVEGLETIEKFTFANGLPAGERRILKSINIIRVD